MIHITRAKGGYMTVMIAKNNKVIMTSEILKSRRSAWKNATSVAGNSAIQDDTVSIPYSVRIKDDGTPQRIKAVKPYVAKRKR